MVKTVQSLQISKIYLDDISVLFGKPEQVLPFVSYLIKKRKSINFLFQKITPFLNFKICRASDKFTASVFTNFSSVIAFEFEFVLVCTL